MASQPLGKVIQECESVASSQTAWKPVNPAPARLSTSLAAATSFQWLGSVPSNTPASGYYFISTPNALAWKFKFLLSHPTAPSAKTGSARIWGIADALPPNSTEREYIGEYLGDLSLTAGATSLNASSKLFVRDGGELVNWVSTISATVDESRSPGMSIYADAANCGAVVEVDASSYAGFIMDLRIGTAAGLAAFWNTI